MQPDILARAYASLAPTPRMIPQRNHSHPEGKRPRRSQAWDADTRTPIDVNYEMVPAYETGGVVDDIPPPPPGFTLDDDIPPPPPGFTLVGETPPPATLADASAATPEPDAAPLSWMQYAEGLAQKVAQGVTFNYGDEAAALAGSLGGLGPMIGGKDYDTILAEVRGREKEFETAQPKTALAAEIAGSLGTGVGTGVTAARLAARLGARPGFLRSAAAAGATAAPLGALNEVGELEGKKSIGEYGEAALEGAGTAALFGAGIGAAGHGLARVVGPWASAAAQRLHDQGIRLTPGELIGGGETGLKNMAKRTEDISGSIPFIGGQIRARRAEGVASMNHQVANEVLEPIGMRVAHDAPAGRELVRDVGDHVSAEYRRVLPHIRGVHDQQLAGEFANIANTLPRDQQAAFNRFVAQEMNNAAPYGTTIDGEGMQHLVAFFRDEGTAMMRAPTFYDRQLGRAFTDASGVLMGNMRLHSPADAVDAFTNANTAYARLVALEHAAGSVGGDAGVFTPAQIISAVKATDRSARKRSFARGEARMQGLADDARSVMGKQVADSGTPERAAMMGAIVAPTVAAPAILAGLPLAALYSRTGNRVFRAAAAGRAPGRTRARDYLERATRAGAPAVGVAATTEN